MSTYVSSSAAGGTSIFTIVYGGIILGKIFGLVTWPWFWILLPFTIIVSLVITALIVWGVLEALQAFNNRKRK